VPLNGTALARRRVPTQLVGYPANLDDVPTETERRLFEAASHEFAERGLAGARVDRIAARAQANKQLIYAYFGDKGRLFDAVADHGLAQLTESVPMDPDDLVGWTVSVFEFIVAHPDAVRLGLWQQLERPEQVRCKIEVDYQDYVDRVARAQSEGTVTSAVSALDLIVMLSGLAASWYSAFAPRLVVDGDLAWSTGLLKSHRAALQLAAHALVSL
jgi:AcrR family transcriptional regulator